MGGMMDKRTIYGGVWTRVELKEGLIYNWEPKFSKYSALLEYVEELEKKNKRLSDRISQTKHRNNKIATNA